MTNTACTPDAVTNGSLVFAIVASFNPQPEPGFELPDYGDGSGDMRGVVRLMDGTTAPFDYGDGRYVAMGLDGVSPRFDDSYVPGAKDHMFNWPTVGSPLLVELAQGRVRRWTWTGLVLGGTPSRRINDSRYLVPPAYDGEVCFPGLHCVINPHGLSREMVEELVSRPALDFEGPAVYIGHQTGAFLASQPAPYEFIITTWDPSLGESRFVSWVTRTG